MIRKDLPTYLSLSVRVVEESEVQRPDEWMSVREIAEAERITNARRRSQWMLGRIAAKRLAIDLGLCEEPRECSVPTRGVKPVFEIRGAQSEMNLSISHSDEIAAATISSRPVGIDIQRRRPIRPGSTKFFLREDESHLVTDCDDSTLLDLWSAKEAALKASGVARYREVHLRERRTDPDRTAFRFEAGTITGEVETIWLSNGELVLALAKGIP